MCGKIITTLEDRIQGVEDKSATEDVIIHNELDEIHSEVDAIESGILSVQGKQFREMCEDLLKQDYITVEEYEEFEEEYAVYKGLGGNHRGDSLHARVVAKVDKQNNKPEIIVIPIIYILLNNMSTYTNCINFILSSFYSIIF